MAFFSTLLRPEFAQSSLLVIIYSFINFIMLTGSLILLEKPVDMSITSKSNKNAVVYILQRKLYGIRHPTFGKTGTGITFPPFIK